MTDTVIRATGLGKKYIIGHKQPQGSYTALRDEIVTEMGRFARRAQHLWRGKRDISDSRSEDFWALRDVDFEIKRGDVVGLVGRNGAGKSTLLKVLSRITEPTRGRVEITGRIASLLEVGTGFHPELTGRENIFLNGALLGMTRADINRKFEQIVEFSEVSDFLDTPVKRYSSGMYVRLAFSVAAHLDPEILIIDEVLAVGDAEFQKKCLGRISDIAGSGRTVLFVSHNTAAIRQLCTSSLLLKQGRIEAVGPVDDVLELYEKSGVNVEQGLKFRRRDTPPAAMYIDSVAAELTGTQPELTLTCEIEVRGNPNSPACLIAVDIKDSLGLTLMQALPSLRPCILSGSAYKLDISLPPLVPGRYAADFWLGPHNTDTVDFVRDAISFEVRDSPSVGRVFPHTRDHGAIVPQSQICSSR